MDIQPMLDNIAIKLTQSQETSEGGIALPESAREFKKEGTVTAVGPGRRDRNGKYMPLDIKVGDVVKYGAHGGTMIDEETMIIKVEHILGIL